MNRRLERDLLAYADGSLPARRRARVERALAASPALRADLAAQRHTLDALAPTAHAPAPAGLRSRLPERLPARPRRGAAALGAGLAAAAAAVALVLALSSGPAAPSVAQAARLALRAPEAAITGSPRTGALPGVRAAGLAFPDWSGRFGLAGTAVRQDRLSGRDATTVYYAGGGERIAYTILSGPPLPAGAALVPGGPAGVQALRVAGLTVVTWQRDGHTCVLAAHGVSVRRLAELAGWSDPPANWRAS
jgi:hypothetical protein